MILHFFSVSYLSEECSQWQQYQKLLQAPQQCSTVQEVLPAVLVETLYSYMQRLSTKISPEKARTTSTTRINTKPLTLTRDIRPVTNYMSTIPRNVVQCLGGLNTAQIVKRHHSPAKENGQLHTPASIYSGTVANC